MSAGAGSIAPLARVLERIYCAILLIGGITWALDVPSRAGLSLIEPEWLGPYLGVAAAAAFLQKPYGHRVGAVDVLAGLASIASWLWLAFHYGGWLFDVDGYTPEKYVPGIIAIATMVEAVRKSCGTAIAVLAVVLIVYGLLGFLLPQPLQADRVSPELLVMYLYSDTNAIPGLVLGIIASVVLAFIVFGKLMEVSGATGFFTDVAMALMGHRRGGPAKIAVVGSSLMGSITGSPVANIMSTGVVTIPLMKRTGYAPAHAAAIEAVASTGGQIAPPIMGATAFVMASFMNVPYAEIALAAVIPSVLYFFGLFVQIDGLAARENLKGLPADELPSLRTTLKEGWYYIFAFGLLIYMLLVMRREALAPFYATPLLILLNQLFSKRHRWSWADVGRFFDALGALFANMVCILAAVGMIIGALSMTGVAATLVNDLLRLAGGSPTLLLLMGAITGLILGTGMTSTAAYIFLAILLAPALIQVGLEPMAVHMFIFYWGMLSFITPPVALGAFAAASLAKTPPMQTGFEAMRLGSVIYFVPFLFVYEPALVLQGSAATIALYTALALAGVALFAYAMQGYLPLVGPLFPSRWYGIPLRIVLLVAAILIAMPADIIPGWTDLDLVLLALALVVPVVVFALFENQSAVRQSTSA